MKKPEKIVMYFTPQKDNSETFFDWNGKECHNYYIPLPFWMVRAYNLHKHMDSVKIEVSSKRKPFTERFDEEQISREYFKSNWARKYRLKRRNTMNYRRISGPSG
jgi:hypothetical protein